MYYTRHERNMQDAFCNFLHMVSYRCDISTLQLAILFIWIADGIDAADPICFIYRIRSSPCRKIIGASFPAGRAYGGQDTDLLQIHLSGLPNASLHSSQVVCTWGSLRNQNSLYKRIPRLAGSCKAGYSYHCSLVGLSGFEPETSSM